MLCQILYCHLHIAENFFKIKLRCMDADDSKTVIFIFLIPRFKIRNSALAVK